MCIRDRRVTVLTCANSKGSHQLPLLLIGKSKYSGAFKNVRKLQIAPNCIQKSMESVDDSSVFRMVQGNIYSGGKKYQKEVGKKGNVLLLIDNTPTHPSVDLLERRNGSFKVLFLWANITSLLQPMDQGVIAVSYTHLLCLNPRLIHDLQHLPILDFFLSSSWFTWAKRDIYSKHYM